MKPTAKKYLDSLTPGQIRYLADFALSRLMEIQELGVYDPGPDESKIGINPFFYYRGSGDDLLEDYEPPESTPPAELVAEHAKRIRDLTERVEKLERRSPQ